LSQDLCLFSVKVLKLAYGLKKAAEEIGDARISRCPPKIVCEVLCFFGQIQMALAVLLPFPQIEIDSRLSALCTLPHEKGFMTSRWNGRQRNRMPLDRSKSPRRITLRYEYVLPIVNQKSIGSAAIEIHRSTRTTRIFRSKDFRYGSNCDMAASPRHFRSSPSKQTRANAIGTSV
jgi:hypothetical protein